MIQPELPALTRALAARGFHITIETAGTVWAGVECQLMSLSPKLANSTPHERESGVWAARHDELRYSPAVLRRLMAAHPYQLKYVVAEEGDLDEILAQVTELHAERERVLLMPEGTEASHLRERGRWVVELCQRYGFRFCPRLHVELWGSRRGV
jgi:7-carboxy-7-deazaguanine synthase